MHNAALAVLGLNWRYLAFDVHPNELRAALAGAQAMRFIGLNLTVPHKLLAVEFVDELDESGKTWGAVNTVRFEGKASTDEWKPLGEFDDAPEAVRSVGFNTDADAIVQSLREDLSLEPAGANILLLGAGGAGRVAALRLAAENVANLYLINRTRTKAAAVADEIRSRFPEVKVTVGYPATNIDLVLNATSLGLKAEDELPLRDSEFPIGKAKAVYDMVYRPAETPLLHAAKAAGCRIANGIGMLLYQGAKALELWTGQKAPIEVMRDALIKNVYGQQQ
jgi:shikimate dehydrogenase